MSDFVTDQWNAYCQRLTESAEYLADGNQELSNDFGRELEPIISEEAPQSYAELLERIQKASQTVRNWQEKSPVIPDEESGSPTPTESAS